MNKSGYVGFDSKANTLICHGEWDISNLAEIKNSFVKIDWPKMEKITIDGKAITKMDSAGAFFLTQWTKKLSGNTIKLHFENFSKSNKNLLSYAQHEQHNEIPKVEDLGWVQRLGRYALEQTHEIYRFINFIGELYFESLRLLANPKLWRGNTVVSTINKAGTSALPIITLVSFMIGVVITYQVGNELRKYGADAFIVNLIGFSILREFGPLLTAIMVAGRTGSAFTAQIGLMKINREVDAINTMGMTSAELLLLPRLIGLLIVLPLLTIWADIFGIIGGMLMAQNMLGIAPQEFLLRFQQEIPLRGLLIGLCKAPLFALIIASIGCFQGIEVGGSSESVGDRTTRSVVLAIFFIIIFDGLLSILLSAFKL